MNERCGPEVMDDATALCIDRDNLKDQNVSLREVLSSIEWILDEHGYFCPSCENGREDGHFGHCKLAAVLSADAMLAARKGEETPPAVDATKREMLAMLKEVISDEPTTWEEIGGRCDRIDALIKKAEGEAT